VGKLRARACIAAFVLVTVGAHAQQKAPLVVEKTIPLPSFGDGDFDHFAADVQGQRLFLAAEDNHAVVILDLNAGKPVHTISDVKAPHSMVYRPDVKQLFVVDGGVGKVKIYDSDSFKPIGSIDLKLDADSMVYEPSTKYMYVVNGGKDADLTYSFISVVDTTAQKNLADIKVDSDAVEALAIEKSGPRLFANLTGKDAVGVIDRQKHTIITTWPTGQVAKHLVAMGFDEAGHRLFVTARNPGKLIALDTDSGKVITSLDCVSNNDDMAYDSASKRIYVSGTGEIDVFQQKDADHYVSIGKVPGAYRARTSILVPEWSRYYLAVPHHGATTAGVRIYKVMP